MRKATSRVLFFALVGGALAAQAQWATDGGVTPPVVQPPEARALSRAFTATVKAVRPSVVRVDVEQALTPSLNSPHGRGPHGQRGELPDLLERFFGDQLPDIPLRGTGSGVVLDANGLIVTNRHVIAGARKVTVTLFDGRELSAKVVGKDARTDVAVIRLERPPKDLVAARLGDSDKAEVGEWALAMGSPMGLDLTVTVGIVSGTGRAGRRIQMSGDRVRRYLQTDAKINPGNSGGPLVNLDGEVIGINTLISAGPGGSYGFAIPINEVRTVTNLLVKEGRVAYAYLGVMVADLRSIAPQLRERLPKGTPEKGAFVSDLTPDSPADKAGLEPGDVIVAIDAREVEWSSDVVDYVSSRPIGSKVTVKLVREGKAKTVQVTLGELPAAEEERAEAQAPEVLEAQGVALQTLTRELAEALGLEGDEQGVVVTDVQRGGVAAKAGLVEGDVIVEIDKKPVSSGADAAKRLEAPKASGHLLRLKGPRGSRFVTLPVPRGSG